MLSTWSPSAIADRFQQRARAIPNAALNLPGCAPQAEFRRSPAAARIGELAFDDGLFLFHFEHRVPLGLPEHWVPEHAPELAEPPAWSAGVLPEAKYQSFQHDLLLGSFHPGHRAKWSTHELCHGLVGFAWKPGASDFFHATAGRLAELLPVALWYGFDEACLRRCERHAGGGALFRTHCAECERVASADAAGSIEGIEVGLRYLDRELAAVERSRRTGTVVPHRFATLDLAEDGVAYAAAHRERLASPQMEAWAQRFLPVGAGRLESLDALIERLLNVAAALVGEVPLPPRVPSPVAGRYLWTVQDLAWRISVVQADCEGEAAAALDGLLDRLSAAVPACLTGDAKAASAALTAAGQEYVALNEEFELALPADVFALGYGNAELPPGDDGAAQLLSEGLATCSVDSLERLDDPAAAVRNLLVRDRMSPRRVPLARRWAESLDGEPADLARYEAMVTTLPMPTPRLTSGAAPWRVRPGVAIESFACDIQAVAAGASGGDPVGIAAWRQDDGEVAVAELDVDVADALQRGEVPEAVGDALQQLGLLEAVRFEE